MLDNHTIASEIIARANDPHPILDDKDLVILRRFCKDPSSKHEILQELDFPGIAGGQGWRRSSEQGWSGGLHRCEICGSRGSVGGGRNGGFAQVVSGRVGVRVEEGWLGGDLKAMDGLGMKGMRVGFV